METNGSLGKERKIVEGRWRRILLPIGALFVGWLVLTTWLAGLAAALEQPVAIPDVDPAAPDIELSISKSSSPLKFTVGSDNKYVIRVSATGTITGATQVKVEDTLPAGLTINNLEFNPATWDCSYISTELYCDFIDVISPPEILPAIVVNVNVASNVEPIITNTAKLYTDGGITPSDVFTLTTIVDSANLSLNKTVEPLYADVGETVTYTLVIDNSGPATATDVEVIDMLPLDVIYSGATTNPALPPTFFVSETTSSQITGTWTLGDLPKGDTITLTLLGRSLPDALGKKLTNTAFVTSTNKSDWNMANNEDSAFYYVSGLQITKTVSTNSAPVGVHYNYNITVHNAGANSATGVRVTDVFSNVLDVVGATINGTSFSTGNSMNRYIGTLGANATADIVVTVRGNENVPLTTTVSNQATVLSSQVMRNSEIVTNTLIPAVDLDVIKTATTADLLPGERISYTVSIENIGSITATNIIFTDTLSDYLNLVSLDENGLVMTGTYTSTNGVDVYAWEFGNEIPPGDTLLFYVGARVATNAPANATVTNEALATSDHEVWMDNNSDFHENIVDEVVSPTDMAINLKVSPTQATIDKYFTFVVTVKNNGGTTATGVVITDTFPSVLNLVSATTTKGTATTNSSTRTVIVDIGSLAPDESETITIVTVVNSSVEKTNTYSHFSRLAWIPDLTENSNTVKFRVVAASTLPGTGGRGAPLEEENKSTWLPLSVGFLLLGYGLLALLQRLWSRRRSLK